MTNAIQDIRRAIVDLRAAILDARSFAEAQALKELINALAVELGGLVDLAGDHADRFNQQEVA